MTFRDSTRRTKRIGALMLTLALSAGCDDASNGAASKTDAPMATPSGPTVPAQPAPPAPQRVAATLNEAVLGGWRSEPYLASDPYRNPEKTFAFFGIASTSRAIEVAPASGYYAEMLAPLLATSGAYAIALPEGDAPIEMRNEIERSPSIYGKAEVRRYPSGAPVFGPAASADVVFVASNLDRWVVDGTIDEAFKAAYEALKPGGVLAIVQPRDNTADAKDGADGYLSEKQVIFQAELAGFSLAQWSELNANPNDTRDHPGGARALPPTFVNGDAGRDAFAAIGEPDRMTLKFVKRP